MTRRYSALAIYAFVLLAPSIAAPAQQPGQEQVAGRVVSQVDKRPIAHAKVTLTDTRNEKIVASTFADDEGHFRFDPVPPGKYRMAGSAANYISARYLQHGTYGTAIVTGAGLATDSLELQLNPISSISGHVLDNGEAVQRATVMLFREDPASEEHVTRSRVAQTNDDGGYEFDRVAPGRYYIVASGMPWYAVHPPTDPPGYQPPFRVAVDPALDVAYPPVFYPSSLDSSGAAPITLHGGEETTADLQMHPEHAVTLTVQLPPGEQIDSRPGPQLFRSIFRIEESVPAQTLYVATDQHTMTITGLAPGQYSLRDFTNNGLPVTSLRIDLTSSGTIADAAARSDTASLTVTARMANGVSLPAQLQVMLHSLPSNQSSVAKLDEKGVAEFQNVPAGDYRLTLMGGPRVTNILALTVDSKPVADKQLHIVKDAHLAAEVSLAQGSVAVEGFVRREEKGVAGAFVALVPAGADTNPELFRRDQSDLDGSFAFNNVVPGNYIVIALDDPAEDLRWTDVPTIMRYLEHGSPVSVPASGVSTVKVEGAVVAQVR